MTDKEQIIINGIDVSGCNYIIDQDPPETRGTWGGAIHKGACKIYSKDCEHNPDCYFKQLARKTQEYKQKEKELKELKRQYKLSCLDCEYKNTKTDADSYRKALEEIEEYTKDPCEYCKPTSKCRECLGEGILNIINKAKGEEVDNGLL